MSHKRTSAGGNHVPHHGSVDWSIDDDLCLGAAGAGCLNTNIMSPSALIETVCGAGPVRWSDWVGQITLDITWCTTVGSVRVKEIGVEA